MPQWKKTHGNQFIITGLKHNSIYYPKIKIIFLETYVQIQCESDDEQTAMFNFTVLMNYFDLKNIFEKPKGKLDLTNIGTSKFNVEQFFLTTQESQLDDLQNVDPVNYGIDDRYEYQKLVTDTQKRPTQILIEDELIEIPKKYKEDLLKYNKNIEKHKKKYNEQDYEQEIKEYLNKGDKENKEDKDDNVNDDNVNDDNVNDDNVNDDNVNDDNVNDDNVNDDKENKDYDNINTNIDYVIGGAKGSPVYINEDYDYSLFLYYQHEFVVNGFVLLNQTHNSIRNRFKCSKLYPYLLLGNTKGKDAISCAMHPLNPYGLSVFEFYDVAQRLLTDLEYINYLRQLLYGRVSLSATKFLQWITPGRCSEIPLDLTKMLTDKVLLLSVLLEERTDVVFSDTVINLEQKIDQKWFESVFGKKYNDIYDGDIIYDYQDDKFYSTNLNGKQMSLWIKFPNHKQYLVIIDAIDIKYINDVKKYYYKPYIYKQKQQQRDSHFNLQFYKKFGIRGYIEFPQINYLVTEKGTFPFIDSFIGLKQLKQNIEDNLPSYETVKKIINDTDNYIINYKGKIIGTNYSGLEFYWKETMFETKQKLKIGTYPLLHIEYPVYFHDDYYSYKPIAFYIYYYIMMYKYIQDDEGRVKLQSTDEQEMLDEILSNKKYIIEITKYLGRLNNKLNRDYYMNKEVPLMTYMSEGQIIDGFNQLKQMLSQQMKFGHLQKLAQFTTNKDLVYDQNNKEEILKLFIKRENEY